jgi:hypothetical protein
MGGGPPQDVSAASASAMVKAVGFNRFREAGQAAVPPSEPDKIPKPQDITPPPADEPPEIRGLPGLVIKLKPKMKTGQDFRVHAVDADMGKGVERTFYQVDYVGEKCLKILSQKQKKLERFDALAPENIAAQREANAQREPDLSLLTLSIDRRSYAGKSKSQSELMLAATVRSCACSCCLIYMLRRCKHVLYICSEDANMSYLYDHKTLLLLLRSPSPRRSAMPHKATVELPSMLRIMTG